MSMAIRSGIAACWLALLGLLSALADGGELNISTNTWVATPSSDDWFDPLNWSLFEPPQPGQTVIIPAGQAPRLTNATPSLGRFELANGATLTFEGWESALTATNIMIAGTVTHLPQTVTESEPGTGEWLPQHRIWFKGSNLTVTVGGSLNADYKGYPPGAGPGRSIDNIPGGGGGGYGGHGGSGYSGTLPGPANGDPADPWQPGSGGGANIASRPAGGAIRVDVEGALTVDGVVSARGQDGESLRGTSGSGGGIALLGRTIHGSGVVRADGGRAHGYSGSGGGGRIAVQYVPRDQAALLEPRPALRFSAVARYADASMTVWPEMGTLYLPDATLLADDPEGDVVLDGQRFWHVRLILGSHPTDWHPASLTITNCVVGFPEGYELHVGGDLVMQGIRGLSTPLVGSLQAGLRLHAAASEALVGARLRVGRDFLVGSDAWFYPHTSGTNPAIVEVRVGRDVKIAAGGGIDADRAGYMPQSGNLNGPGAGLSNESGGSYGGHGGGASYRPAYGEAALPLDPGSPGGWRVWGDRNYTAAGSGGGVIHLLAGNDIRIDGVLSANGTSGVYYRGPGGSGGSIFLAGRRVVGAGELRANGGAGGNSRAPGGGGRIAVWRHMPLSVVEQRIANRDVRSLTQADKVPGFSGTLSMEVYASDIAEYDQAETGTAGFYGRASTLLILR